MSFIQKQINNLNIQLQPHYSPPAGTSVLVTLRYKTYGKITVNRSIAQQEVLLVKALLTSPKISPDYRFNTDSCSPHFNSKVAL